VPRWFIIVLRCHAALATVVVHSLRRSSPRKSITFD
jgi:hypothetical protein